MAYRFQPQPTRKLTLVVFEGVISPEEEREAVAEFAAHPDVDFGADVLVDRSRATMTVGVDDVMPHVDHVRAVMPKAERQPRMAVVAPTDIDFGMFRMLEMSGGDALPHRIMVCRTLEDACEWLGVDKDELVWP